MKLKTVETPPTDGTQFIASWINNKQPWAEVRKYKDGRLHIYDPGLDDWVKANRYDTDTITFQIAEPQPLTTSEILIALGEGRQLQDERGNLWQFGGRVVSCSTEGVVNMSVTQALGERLFRLESPE